MGATLWHFLEHTDGAMARLTAARVDAFLYRGGKLEHAGRDELRFVEVMLEVERRAVRRIYKVWCIRRRIRPDGSLDPEHARDAVRSAVAGIGLLSRLQDDASGDVVELQPHLARQRAVAEHRWTPTGEQLQQVLGAIHRACADPPVAVISEDGELVPV